MQKRRVFSLAAATLVLGSLASVCAAGCADTEGTFYVLNAVAGAAENGSCTFGAEAAPLLGGQYELAAGFPYSMGLVLRNELSTRKETETPRVETMHVEIYAVDVSLEGKGVLGGADCPSTFTYPSKGFVEPQEDGATATLVVPACMRTQIQAAMAPGESQTLIATFVVHGHTTGGDEVESPEYEFPIQVYNGTFCTPKGSDTATEDVDISCGVGVNTPAPADYCGN